MKILTEQHTQGKVLFALIVFLFFGLNGIAQEDKSSNKEGKIYGDLFLNGNYNISQEYASFRLNRLHLGYKHNLSSTLYFNGMIESALEAYQPIAVGGDYNGITNLFEFCLGYHSDKLDGKFGLIGTEFNQQQEKLWKHRNIDKVFGDKYGFSPTNDFGAMVIYKAHERFKIDLAITNGEGHKNLQADSNFRIATGLTFNLNELLFARLFTDFMSINDETQSNLIGTIGISKEKYAGGFEWNQQTNCGGAAGFSRSGFSVYASGFVKDKIELFARYDDIGSNKPNGIATSWNLVNDGSLLIGGVQYSISNNVTVALDYRSWTPANSAIKNQSFIFCDVALSF